MSNNQPPPPGQGQNPHGAGEEPTRIAGSKPAPSGPPQQYGAPANGPTGGQPNGPANGPGGYGQSAPAGPGGYDSGYGQSAQTGPGGYGGGYGGGGYGGNGGNGQQPPKKSRTGLFAVLGVVLLLIIAGIVVLFLFLGNDDDKKSDDKADEKTSESSDPSEDTSDDASDDSSDDPSEDTSDDASGETVTGANYTYSVPADWSDVTSEVTAQEPSVDTAVAAGSSLAGASANIIVEAGPAAGETDPEAGRANWKKNLKASTGATPEDIDNSEIGGEDAIGERIERTNENGVDIVQIGYLTIQDDQVIAVTISTTTDNEDAAMEKFEELSSSWEWQ